MKAKAAKKTRVLLNAALVSKPAKLTIASIPNAIGIAKIAAIQAAIARSRTFGLSS
jgi:hypothetical protein